MRDRRGRLPAPGLRNELVNWFNTVDATYRTDLRELNELNFTRFDAKLEQRLAETRADLSRFDAKLEQRLAETRADLIKWMFGFWAASTFTTLGAAIGIVTLLLRR